MALWEEIKLQEEEIVRVRRDLHRIPELGMQEKKTTQYIRDMLQGYSVEVHDIGLETGLCVLIRGNHPGRTIALRFDIDALPLEEASGLPFSSEHPGVCHACGHDLHATMGVFVARYLSSHREHLWGNVWIYFQPSEENLKGAKAMIEAGCLDLDPRPESILMLHCHTPLEIKRFGIIRGASSCSCDNMRITVRSTGGHGGFPHRCGDTILAAGYLVAQLQTAVSRENNCMQPAVLSFGSIHGGVAPNVIPAEVVIEGTLRALYPESREKIKDSIRRISENACVALRTECTVEFLEPSVPCLQNDPAIVDRVENAIKKLFGQEAIHYMESPSSGSEDFSNYLQYIPGAMIRLGTQNINDPQTALGQHAVDVRFDEGGLCHGIAFMCQYVEDYLSEK